MLPVVVALGIGAGIFFGKVFFLRELLLFIAIVVLLALFAANLLVLGIVFQTAGRSILQFVRAANPAVVQENANSEGPRRAFLESPTIGAAPGTRSSNS
jgi:hypothetical protein